MFDFSIILETMNTSKMFSVQALVNFGTIKIFINYSFVEKHYVNIYKLFKFVLVYNINSTSNKNRQISEMIDVVLYYLSYFEWTLLIVSNMSKQDLILSFIWLKITTLR